VVRMRVWLAEDNLGWSIRLAGFGLELNYKIPSSEVIYFWAILIRIDKTQKNKSFDTEIFITRNSLRLNLARVNFLLLSGNCRSMWIQPTLFFVCSRERTRIEPGEPGFPSKLCTKPN
jgi:hypothetical protein